MTTRELLELETDTTDQPLGRGWAESVTAELEGAKAWAGAVNETLGAGVQATEAHGEAIRILNAHIENLETRLRALEGRAT